MRHFALLRSGPVSAALLGALLLLGGCDREGRPGAPGVISRSRFIAANVAMRSIPDSTPNANSARRAALKKHRVTEKDLRAFVAAHSRDTEALSQVWQEIARELERADSVRRAKEMPTPPTQPPHQPPPVDTLPRRMIIDPAGTPDAQVPPPGAGPPPPPRPMRMPPPNRMPPRDTLRSPLTPGERGAKKIIPPPEGQP